MCCKQKHYKLPQINIKMTSQEINSQVQFLLSDFNTRLRDLDERNRLIRERVLLLGKNLLGSREEIEEEMRELKKDNFETKKELERIKIISKNLLSETEKFVKKDEIRIIERMLKDFQPLEFARKKDIQEIVEKLIKKAKSEIK
jgi:hypothetical protein